MSWIKERSIVILGAFINILFALKLMKDSLRIKNFNYLYIIFLYFLSLCIYWFYGYILKNKKYRMITNVTILVFLGTILYKNKIWVYKFVQREFVDNLNNLYDLANKLEPTPFSAYKYIFILSFLVVVPIVIALAYRFNNIIILMNFAYIISMWFIGYVDEVKGNLKLYLFITLFSNAIFIYSKRKKKLLKENIQFRVNIKKILIYSCIFSIIISSISAVLPQKFLGKCSVNYKGKFVNKFARQFEKNPLDVAKVNSYDLAYSGYSNNDKKLGGRIILSDKVAFEIEGGYAKYMRGNMKDYYTGESWRRSSNINFRKKDEIGTMLLGKYDLGNSKKAGVKINPKELKTTSLMVPLHTYDIDGTEGMVYYDDTPVCMASEVQHKSYNVKYTKEAFETLEEFNKYITTKSFPYTHYFLGSMIYSQNAEKQFLTNEALEKEKEKCYSSGCSAMDTFTVKDKYKNYLQVSNTIPERVFDLTYDIVEDSGSNEEKVKSIMNYLNKNYRYDLEVFDVPEDKDFVDYFLFEEKKGYCTYFATTMTNMCRIAGVPARYVEGFKVDKKEGKNARINVTNEEAHAWCEVLVDPERDLWVIADPSPTPVEHRRKKKKQTKVDVNIDNIKPNSNKKNQMNIQNENNIAQEQGQNLNKKATKVIFITVSIIGVLILNLILRKIKVRKIVSDKSIIPLYCYTFNRLKSIGITKGESIGDREFVESIKEEPLRTNLLNMVDVYYKEHYGNIVDNEFNKEKFLDFIEKYILSKQGKLKYYTKLFFLNFIIFHFITKE